MEQGDTKMADDLLRGLERRFPNDIRRQIASVDSTLAVAQDTGNGDLAEACRQVQDRIWLRVEEMQKSTMTVADMQKRLEAMEEEIRTMKSNGTNNDMTLQMVVRQLNQLTAYVMTGEGDVAEITGALPLLADTTTVILGRGKKRIRLCTHDRCKMLVALLGINEYKVVNQESMARIMQIISGIPWSTLKTQFSPAELSREYSSPELEELVNSEIEAQGIKTDRK